MTTEQQTNKPIMNLYFTVKASKGIKLRWLVQNPIYKNLYHVNNIQLIVGRFDPAMMDYRTLKPDMTSREECPLYWEILTKYATLQHKN